MTLHRFVLENSGVAEPQNIRDQFNEAIAAGNPLMQRIQLDTLVTIVDAGTFIRDYSSRSPLAARPDLGEGGNLRPVVDLLVEQIECVPSLVSSQACCHALLLKMDLVSGYNCMQVRRLYLAEQD
jgi:G3E family GTPase